jgi:phosphate transport system protein
MSHLEERLERDLGQLRKRLATMASAVQEAIKNSVHAVQTGNRKLAYNTVLEDLPINRTVREIDRLCHQFVAVHLPSAGHLRLVSAAIRTNIALERIGDYAVTICREAVRLSEPPEGVIALELERLASESQMMLRQSIRAFNDQNAELARGNMAMADEIEGNMDSIYDALAAEASPVRIKDILSMFVIFAQLKRISDQAKNICEDTVFAVTGDAKAPKVYNILFLDEDNSCLSQMAEAIARKNFPGSGSYSSAGSVPAAELNPVMVSFLGDRGIGVKELYPKPLSDLSHQDLVSQHVVVSLQGPLSSYVLELPFHTTGLEWDLGPVPEQQEEKRFEDVYRQLALQIKDLMELMRGEEAP